MKKILIIPILFALISCAPEIFAQEECPPQFRCLDPPLCKGAGGHCLGQYICRGGTGCCCKIPGEIARLIESVVEYVMNIVIVGAGIIIIIGGYLMVTSAGNPEQFKKGQKTLLYGAIGFILVFAAKELAEEIMKIVK